MEQDNFDLLTVALIRKKQKVPRKKWRSFIEHCLSQQTFIQVKCSKRYGNQLDNSRKSEKTSQRNTAFFSVFEKDELFDKNRTVVRLTFGILNYCFQTEVLSSALSATGNLFPCIQTFRKQIENMSYCLQIYWSENMTNGVFESNCSLRTTWIGWVWQLVVAWTPDESYHSEHSCLWWR